MCGHHRRYGIGDRRIGKRPVRPTIRCDLETGELETLHGNEHLASQYGGGRKYPAAEIPVPSLNVVHRVIGIDRPGCIGHHDRPLGDNRLVQYARNPYPPHEPVRIHRNGAPGAVFPVPEICIPFPCRFRRDDKITWEIVQVEICGPVLRCGVLDAHPYLPHPFQCSPRDIEARVALGLRPYPLHAHQLLDLIVEASIVYLHIHGAVDLSMIPYNCLYIDHFTLVGIRIVDTDIVYLELRTAHGHNFPAVQYVPVLACLIENAVMNDGPGPASLVAAHGQRSPDGVGGEIAVSVKVEAVEIVIHIADVDPSLGNHRRSAHVSGHLRLPDGRTRAGIEVIQEAVPGADDHAVRFGNRCGAGIDGVSGGCLPDEGTVP